MAESQLHKDLGEYALIWLQNKATNRGIKGCVEIQLKKGYVADAVSLCGLQLGWQSKLIGTMDRGDGVHILKYHNELPDFVFVFESKVSVSDFKNTFVNKGHKGDRLEPVGHFHFVVTPPGLLDPEDIPSFWGLLELRGAGLSIKKMPEFCMVGELWFYMIAYQLLRFSERWGKYSIV